MEFDSQFFFYFRLVLRILIKDFSCFVINSRTAIAGAIIGLLLVFNCRVLNSSRLL